jgi:hypothetical protein
VICGKSPNAGDDAAFSICGSNTFIALFDYEIRYNLQKYLKNKFKGH